MKIHVPKILSNGLTVPLNSQETWFAELMTPYFNDPLITIDQNSLGGKVHLTNADGEVDINGDLHFDYSCACARCGEDLKKQQKIRLQKHASPWDNTTKTNFSDDDDEIDFNDDSLNLIFYKNDEIDLAPILNDEIALSFPYNHYCEDKTACEKRFESQLKTANAQNPTDPRWAALKNFKAKT